MDSFTRIDKILKTQPYAAANITDDTLSTYASALCLLENLIVVVTDLRNNSSKIFAGGFGRAIGLPPYSTQSSIWEQNIIDMMPESEKEEKFKAELIFFHFLRRMPRQHKSQYYLATKLKFNIPDKGKVDVLHRMYYIHDLHSDSVSHAFCVYGPLCMDFPGRSVIINSVNGLREEISDHDSLKILSGREVQVLKLIGAGKSSQEIAAVLCISKHTVSRHRQEIIAKLQVKNSIEALKVAKSLNLL